MAELSRATSRTSAHSRSSTLSRNQSLIKKNIELHDLKPADLLIERFVAWKSIVKQLTAYFEGIADIESNTAKELTKLAGVIQVPFRAGNQFLGEGGLQDVYYDIRNKTRIIADQHADLGRTINNSIVQHLQKLRTEIKAHLRNVQSDTGRLAASVAKERENSTKLVGELANSISTFKNTPMNLQPRQDPFVANRAVARQLQRQVMEENLLQKSLVMMQQNSAHFEEGIVRSIQSAWQTFDEWKSRASISSQEIFRDLGEHVASLTPDREWIQFAARSDHLLHPDTPLRDPQMINYPLKDDPSVIPVHVGHLSRKSRLTRGYGESYFVLTPAGFLHEFSSADPKEQAGVSPTFSLFLPTCTLGPASSPRTTGHKFHIEGRKDGVGMQKTGSFKGFLGGEGAKAWTFRARSREEMMEWWNDIRMLCARYLVASEQIDRTGPAESAVRSAGYPTDEEFEVMIAEEEEEGSSVDEEQEGEGIDDYADQEHAPPGYTHPSDKHYVGVEVGPNGYAIDKKSMGDYASGPEHAPYYASVPPADDYSRGYVHNQAVYAHDQAPPSGKRLSQRQMGKTRDAGGYDAGAQDGEVDAGLDRGEVDATQRPSLSRTSSGFSAPKASAPGDVEAGDKQTQVHDEEEEEEEGMYEQEEETVETEHKSPQPAPARGGIFSNITSSIGIFGTPATPPPPPVQEVQAR